MLVITVCLLAALPAQVIRVDCGSPTPYIDGRGFAWQADRPYDPMAPMAWGYEGGAAFPGTGVQILGGTPDQPLFRIARQGALAYRFNLPAGDYAVAIGLAEVVHHGPGLRSFSISLEGTPLVVDLDLMTAYTRDYATWRRARVTVADGVLDVDMSASIGETIVCCIEVIRISADSQPPPTPPAIVAHDGFGGITVVDFADVGGPDFAGYVVERASSASGPWSPASAGIVHDSRFLDPAPLAGINYYRVRSVDLWGNQSAPTAVVAAETRPDSSTALPIIVLTLDPQDQLFLDSDPFADVYVPAQATIAGKVQALACQVRYRGNVSRKFPKKSWKVNLDGDAPFAGRDKLNLKSEFIEYSMIRDEVAYELHRQRGVPTPDTRQVQLRVGGVYRGVFLDLEQIDEAFLDRHRLDPAGEVYKSNSGDLRTFPLPALYEVPWEKETDVASGFGTLIGLCQAIASLPAAEFPREITRLVDVQEMLDYWALRIYVADTDFTFHNFYLYRSSIGGHFMFLPWDMDHSFGNVGPFSTMIRADTPLDAGTSASPLGPGGGLTGTYNRLFDRMMTVPLFQAMFCDKLSALMAGDLQEGALHSRLDDARARILDDALADVAKCGWEDDRRFLEALTLLHDFVPQRHAYLSAAIAAYRPALVPGLTINEVLLLNPGVALDEVGEAESYVEIHNAAASLATLDGMRLEAAPGVAFVFPAGTSIPAGGRAIVWCDGEPGDGPQHTAFTLDPRGGHLALLAADGITLVDTVAWDRQLEGLALARLGDGGPLFALATPSPGAANPVARANRPPVVWAHARVPDLPAAMAPVDVTAVVDDDDGDSPLVVVLFHDAGAGLVATPMQDDGASADGAAGDGRYGARIPGYPGGTSVDYWIEATDPGGAVGRSPELTGVHSYVVQGGPCVPSCGDCNEDGVVSILDALLAAQHGVGSIVLPAAAFTRCDVDAGGSVDVLDALALARAALGALVLSCCP